MRMPVIAGLAAARCCIFISHQPAQRRFRGNWHLHPTTGRLCWFRPSCAAKGFFQLTSSLRQSLSRFLGLMANPVRMSQACNYVRSFLPTRCWTARVRALRLASSESS
jgi:hypothetical protein